MEKQQESVSDDARYTPSKKNTSNTRTRWLTASPTSASPSPRSGTHGSTERDFVGMVVHEGLGDGGGFDGVDFVKDARFPWTFGVRLALFGSFGHRLYLHDFTGCGGSSACHRRRSRV